MNKDNGWYSWPVIIVFFFLFWPVGVYLLIKRISMKNTPAYTTNNAIKSYQTLDKVAKILYVILGIAFISVAASEGNPGYAVLVTFPFFAIAIALQSISKKLEKEDKIAQKYLTIILRDNETNLYGIAAKMNSTYEKVKVDIQNLIDKGILRNVYISEAKKEVVISGNNVNEVSNNNVKVTAKPRVVTCTSCGANNTILGEIGECEYCGSPIK